MCFYRFLRFLLIRNRKTTFNSTTAISIKRNLRSTINRYTPNNGRRIYSTRRKYIYVRQFRIVLDGFWQLFLSSNVLCMHTPLTLILGLCCWFFNFIYAFRALSEAHNSQTWLYSICIYIIPFTDTVYRYGTMNRHYTATHTIEYLDEPSDWQRRIATTRWNQYCSKCDNNWWDRISDIHSQSDACFCAYIWHDLSVFLHAWGEPVRRSICIWRYSIRMCLRSKQRTQNDVRYSIYIF